MKFIKRSNLSYVEKTDPKGLSPLSRNGRPNKKLIRQLCSIPSDHNGEIHPLIKELADVRKEFLKAKPEEGVTEKGNVEDSKTQKGFIQNQRFDLISTVFKAIALKKIKELESNPIDFSKTEEYEKGMEFLRQLNVEEIEVLFKTSVDVHNKLIKSNGIKEGTKRWKAISNHIITLLEGGNPSPTFAVGKDLNFPTKLHHLRELYKNSSKFNYFGGDVAEQLLRSILGVNRLVEDFSEVDTTSIVTVIKTDEKLPTEFKSFLDEFLKSLSEEERKLFKDFGKWTIDLPTMLGRNGPNGENKLNTAMQEAAALVLVSGTPMGQGFAKLCVDTGNDDFLKYVISCGKRYLSLLDEFNHLQKEVAKLKANKSKNTSASKKGKKDVQLLDSLSRIGMTKSQAYNSIKELKGKVKLTKKLVSLANANEDQIKELYSRIDDIRKEVGSPILQVEEIKLRFLTSVPDVGNKSRTVAICDFWTQLLLAGLEDKLKNLALGLFGKCFDLNDHQLGFHLLFKKLSPGMRSIDYSSWTDNFSAVYQRIVLAWLTDEGFSKAWSDLVVTCPWSVKDQEGQVCYGTGQGMGTKGSFIIACVTDILLTIFAYKTLYGKELGIIDFKTPLTYFRCVGDDNVKYDPRGLIQKFWTDRVRIPINISKSKIASKDNLCMEYVSMNVNYGKNVSRISVGLCNKARKDVYTIPALVLHLSQRCDIEYDVLFSLLCDTIIKKKELNMLYDVSILAQIFGMSFNDQYRLIEEGLRKGVFHDKLDEYPNNIGMLSQTVGFKLIALLLAVQSLKEREDKLRLTILKVFSVDPQILESIGIENLESKGWNSTLSLNLLIGLNFYKKSFEILTKGDYTLAWEEIFSCETVDHALALVFMKIQYIAELESSITYSGGLYYNTPDKKIREVLPFWAKFRNKLAINVSEDGEVSCYYVVDNIYKFEDGPLPQWVVDNLEAVASFLITKESAVENYKGYLIGTINRDSVPAEHYEGYLIGTLESQDNTGPSFEGSENLSEVGTPKEDPTLV